ncbi:Uncharacterised protein [[Clostridium] sordellii]|nr:Uncharacterised protein [[Clostridium] sordellii] [Paeniclostridium sordellii]
MALVINPLDIVNLSDVIPPACIFSELKLPFIRVFILPTSTFNICIVAFNAFKTVISALSINAFFILACFIENLSKTLVTDPLLSNFDS